MGFCSRPPGRAVPALQVAPCRSGPHRCPELILISDFPPALLQIADASAAVRSSMTATIIWKREQQNIVRRGHRLTPTNCWGWPEGQMSNQLGQSIE